MGGACSIRDDKGNDLSVKQGETILIPADTKSVGISPEGNVLLLETYL
jgi:mannose-6-phosphate isomerase